MIQTVEAIIDENGQVHLLGAIHVSGRRRALVTILEEPGRYPDEATLLSESALAEDWSRLEEEAVWSHLQSEK
jgi:hypothetical protein